MSTSSVSASDKVILSVQEAAHLLYTAEMLEGDLNTLRAELQECQTERLMEITKPPERPSVLPIILLSAGVVLSFFAGAYLF